MWFTKSRCVLISVMMAYWSVSPLMAAGEEIPKYGNNDLRGEWIWSGLLKFSAPIPFPGTVVDGAPPHAAFPPGAKVGIWGAILGTMNFDGKGKVRANDVFKPGEVEPLPFPYIPPLPELHVGTYVVHSNGVVEMNLHGRDPGSPEGQVDFETDYHCQLNRSPREMTCVISRFKTFFVDPSGYLAPITGIITFKKRH